MGPEFVDTAVNAAIQVFMWVGFLATLWALIRPFFKQRRLVEGLPSRSDLYGLVQRIAELVVKELPSKLNAKLLEERDRLLALNQQLRMQHEWKLIAVQVYGFQDPNWADRNPHVSVWFNIVTGEFKAPEERFRRISGKLERLDEIIGPAQLTPLGAPSYRKISNSEIVMLDVVYRL